MVIRQSHNLFCLILSQYDEQWRCLWSQYQESQHGYDHQEVQDFVYYVHIKCSSVNELILSILLFILYKCINGYTTANTEP